MKTSLLQSASLVPMFGAGIPARPALKPNRKSRRAAISDKRLRTHARHAERLAQIAVRDAADEQARLSALLAWSKHTRLADAGIARMVAPVIGEFAAAVAGVQTLDERVRARLAKQSTAPGFAR